MTKELFKQICKISEIVIRIIFLITFHSGRSILDTIFGRKLKSVKNKIVLITGGAQGIGRELAFEYAAAGAIVIICDVNISDGRKTVKDLAESGHTSAYFYVCDVTNRDDVFSMAQKIQKQVGDVTILINNAGIAYINLFLDHSKNDVEKLMNVNVMAQYWTVQAFLPSMIKRKDGHIVALGSVAGIFGIPYSVPYSTSKYATRGLMAALYQEHRDSNPNIKFTTILPYFAHTKIVDTNRITVSKLFPILDPKFVAKEILNAQRKNIVEISIPKLWSYLYIINNLFPQPVRDYIFDLIKPDVEI